MPTRVHLITQEEEDEEPTMAPPPEPVPAARAPKVLKQLTLFGDPIVEAVVPLPSNTRSVPVTAHNRNGTPIAGHNRNIKITPTKAAKKRTTAKQRRLAYLESEEFKMSEKVAFQLHVQERIAYLDKRKQKAKK